ncbi:MAG TPA: tyrosine-protein phosphatase [Terriglobia bacterium]|nr:tyrosine-protein phosphatase [Terriglobia bacterium]
MLHYAVLLFALVPSQMELSTPELPAAASISRFSIVDEGIYRGGQPNKEGFAFLKERGVKTIINLRAKDDEGEMVRGLGMQYFHIPIRLVFPWSKISDDAIKKYFEVVNDPDNHPIFFHCHRGADRTGTLAALYRIANQGWNAERAWFEARDIGLHWWYRGLKGQVHGFDAGEPVIEPATVEP